MKTRLPKNVMARSFRMSAYIGDVHVRRECRVPSVPAREWSSVVRLKWRKASAWAEADCGVISVLAYPKTRRSGPLISFHLRRPVADTSGLVLPAGLRHLCLQQCWIPEELFSACADEQEKFSSLMRVAEILLARWFKKCRMPVPDHKKHRRTSMA